MASRHGNGGRPTRAAVRQVDCPICFVRGGEPCVSVGKFRRELQHHHLLRVQRYRDGLYGPTPSVGQQAEETDRV